MVEIIIKLLTRVLNTKQQTQRGRRERLENVDSAFALSKKRDLSQYHIFLIDNVTTTGATLVEAARPLKSAGAKVTLLALART